MQNPVRLRLLDQRGLGFQLTGKIVASVERQMFERDDGARPTSRFDDFAHPVGRLIIDDDAADAIVGKIRQCAAQIVGLISDSDKGRDA